MAIARGAGTEIIRSASFEDVDSTPQILIYGAQHHIYTVLSITMFCGTLSGTEKGYIQLIGYDADAGTTAQTHSIASVFIGLSETFVWNDKFSFNGHEPTDFAGPMDSIVKQDAIADQGSSVAQYIRCGSDSVNTKYDVTVTYIDQNNA